MNAQNEERRGRQGGFTLIEVLLVVAILGILAAIVVVNVSGRREEAMVRSTRASIASVRTALDLYEVDTGTYPSSLQSLLQNSDNAPNWHGPYINSAAVDSWGTALGYQKTDTGVKVTSAGADKAMGSSDDLTD